MPVLTRRSLAGALAACALAAAAAHNASIDRLDAVRARIRTTSGGLRGARRDLGRAHRVVQARIVALYKRPAPTLPELLVGAGSLTQARSAVDAIDLAAQADAGAVEGVRTHRDRLARLLVRRREVLDGARADLRRMVREEQERRRREAEERRARLLAARAGAPYRAGEAPLALPPGGGHVFPVRGPVRFADDWLFARPGGRMHVGIDLFAARGAPVIAVADGTLSRVGWNGLGDWRLWLRDGAGTELYYAHLDAFAPAAVEGASVARGTVIGFVGTTGDAQGTSPHVHFEVHPGGSGPTRSSPRGPGCDESVHRGFTRGQETRASVEEEETRTGRDPVRRPAAHPQEGTRTMYQPHHHHHGAHRDPAAEGVVAHLSRGGFGPYHRLECPEAPHRGDPGVRDTIHGPWRYLSAHWRPCPRCRPPVPAGEARRPVAA